MEVVPKKKSLFLWHLFSIKLGVWKTGCLQQEGGEQVLSRLEAGATSFMFIREFFLNVGYTHSGNTSSFLIFSWYYSANLGLISCL